MKAYLEPEEVALMEKATTNLRDRLLIRLLFRLGCRISEALGLAIEDVDFERRTIIIKHLKARLKLSCTGCGQRDSAEATHSVPSAAARSRRHKLSSRSVAARGCCR